MSSAGCWCNWVNAGAVIIMAIILATSSSCVSAQCSNFLLTTAPPFSFLSVQSINNILTAHNNARRTVSPAAAVMPMLTWNATLATFAQQYMATCVGLVHSSSTDRSNPARFGYSYIGENLAAGSSSSYDYVNGGVLSTDAWNAERADFTYSSNTCASGKACGHYTQVVWANTLQVGCGYAYCPDQPYKNYWSCVYGPGGNYVGQKPYVEATATSRAVCQVTGTLTPPPSIVFGASPGTTTIPSSPGTPSTPGTPGTSGGSPNTPNTPGTPTGNSSNPLLRGIGGAAPRHPLDTTLFVISSLALALLSIACIN